MKDAGVAGFLVEEEAEDGEVEDRQPEVDRREVFVLLHEEIGPARKIKINSLPVVYTKTVFLTQHHFCTITFSSILA